LKILFLCKRYPQRRDLLEHPYGRFFYLPLNLARLGHQVTLLLLGYDNKPTERRQICGMDWHSVSLRPKQAGSGLFEYLALAGSVAKSMSPDWIVGLSDTWYGILAQHLGTRHGIKTAIDAYDNFESYIPGAKPLHWAWRHACRNVELLTAPGPDLLAKLSMHGSRATTCIVPMAADPNFKPLERGACRSELSLPPDLTLVGYCGSVYRNRGIEQLFDALSILRRELPGIRLVISGRRQKGLKVPSPLEDIVIDRGYLPDDQVPKLLSAMDVLLSINRPSSFGNYSYPAKVYEAMQCSIPVIATDVSSTRWILRDHPECLAPAFNSVGLAMKIREATTWGRRHYSDLTSWETSATALNDGLNAQHH
jgi:glycosyltransferase involved in cell wall biosynthesis